MILVLFRPRRGPLPLAGLGWATLPVLEKNHRYLAIEMDGWRLIHDPLNPFYYPETKKNKNTQGFPMTPRVSHTHTESVAHLGAQSDPPLRLPARVTDRPSGMEVPPFGATNGRKNRLFLRTEGFALNEQSPSISPQIRVDLPGGHSPAPISDPRP